MAWSDEAREAAAAARAAHSKAAYERITKIPHVKTAEQVGNQAHNEWFNNGEARKAYGNGKSARQEFVKDVVAHHGGAEGEKPAASDQSHVKVGNLVRFEAPGPNGPMKLAGTIKSIKPGGMVEIKSQAHGYHTIHESKVKPPASAETHESLTLESTSASPEPRGPSYTYPPIIPF